MLPLLRAWDLSLMGELRSPCGGKKSLNVMEQYCLALKMNAVLTLATTQMNAEDICQVK